MMSPVKWEERRRRTPECMVQVHSVEYKLHYLWHRDLVMAVSALSFTMDER